MDRSHKRILYVLFFEFFFRVIAAALRIYYLYAGVLPLPPRYSFLYLFVGVCAEKKVLHILATLPSYRRLGVGSLLLAHGLEVVDKANSLSYLDSSSLGLNLYLKHGWRAVDEIRVDLGKYGIDKGGEEVSMCMIREPKGL